MGRTTIIMHDPYAAQAELAEATLRFYRDNYRRADEVARQGHMLTDAGLHPAAPRYLPNCCNCGAPRTDHECSYCRSVTP